MKVVIKSHEIICATIVKMGGCDYRKREDINLSKCLGELKPKEKGKIVSVGGRGSIRRRLLDMGLVSGGEIEVERVAPLGDPIEIRIKGYHLALRKNEASNIQVEVE